MTIEQKALELVRACPGCEEWDCIPNALIPLAALHRALEAHEADNARHAAEMREQAERFSGAVTGFWNYCKTTDTPFPAALAPFIPAPVDPLVEAMSEAMCGIPGEDYTQPAADLRAALDARGLAIVKKEAVNG